MQRDAKISASYVPPVHKRFSKLPTGHYFVGEIETAITNLILSKADLLPKRPNNSKIKVNRLSLLEGVAQYLLRLLLLPNQIGEKNLNGLHGKVHLWCDGKLMTFDDDGLLAPQANHQNVSTSDLLFLDDEPFLPPSLEKGVSDDDAFVNFLSMVSNDLLCIDPDRWIVRKQPKVSLDSFEKYSLQSRKISRRDFEFELAREAWKRAEPYSGGKLVYSLPRPGKNPPFRRPSEIAKLVEKEFVRLCDPDRSANKLIKSEINAEKAIEAFRKLSEKEQCDFIQARAAKIMGYNSTTDSGFIRAYSTFRSKLTDIENQRLPGPGRPRKL